MRKLLRWAALALVLGALGLLPFRAADVAELLPVKTIVVSRAGEDYVIDVGAGVRSLGATLREALDALSERVSGKVFFGTAEQVVGTEEAAAVLPELAEQSVIRPAAGLCLSPERDLDPEAVGEYLAAHPPGCTVLTLRAALAAGEQPRLPRLVRSEGGYRIRESA